MSGERHVRCRGCIARASGAGSWELGGAGWWAQNANGGAGCSRRFEIEIRPEKPEEGTLKDEGTQHPASTRIPRPEVTRDSVSCWVWVLPASQSLYNARAGIITWLTS